MHDRFLIKFRGASRVAVPTLAKTAPLRILLRDAGFLFWVSPNPQQNIAEQWLRAVRRCRMVDWYLETEAESEPVVAFSCDVGYTMVKE